MLVSLSTFHLSFLFCSEKIRLVGKITNVASGQIEVGFLPCIVYRFQKTTASPEATETPGDNCIKKPYFFFSFITTANEEFCVLTHLTYCFIYCIYYI